MEQVKYLTVEEYQRVLSVIENDTDNPRQKRNLAIICAGEYFALRVSEICNLRKSWYNRGTCEMYCERGKNSNNNMLRIIDPKVSNAINSYLDSIHGVTAISPYMFPSPLDPNKPICRETITKMVKKYFKLANITNPKLYHPHTLKHTRGQELADKGLDIKEVQYWLGHRSARNTQIYFQFSQQQQIIMYNKLQGNVESEK